MKPDYKKIIELYYKKGFTMMEIAVQYKCGVNTIRKIMKRHKMPVIRSKSKSRKILIQKSKIPLQISRKFGDFNSQESEVILGSLLGDSNLRRRKNKDQDKHNVHFGNCEAQKKYVEFKHGFFNETRVNPIRIEKRSVSVINDKEYNVQNLHAFSTRSDNLENLYDMLIKDGTKTVTMEYLRLLTPLSLLIWYMDDGSYSKQNRTIRIATMGFTVKENNVIKSFFYNCLKIPCMLDKTKYGFGRTLSLPQNSAKKFLNLVKPYVPNNIMSYKFPLPLRDFEHSQCIDKAISKEVPEWVT